MAKVASITFNNVSLPKKNRDFKGAKFGPQNRQFSVVIDDPGTIEKIVDLGVKVYFPPTSKDEVPAAFVNVKIDNRYGDIVIILDDDNGNMRKLPFNRIDDLDDMWIKSVDAACVINHYKNMRSEGYTVYCKTLICHTMSEEEQEEYNENTDNSYTDSLRKKYEGLLGE